MDINGHDQTYIGDRARVRLLYRRPRNNNDILSGDT
jgi:hypothetical protein